MHPGPARHRGLGSSTRNRDRTRARTRTRAPTRAPTRAWAPARDWARIRRGIGLGFGLGLRVGLRPRLGLRLGLGLGLGLRPGGNNPIAALELDEARGPEEAGEAPMPCGALMEGAVKVQHGLLDRADVDLLLGHVPQNPPEQLLPLG
jgi:hypothetical protein